MMTDETTKVHGNTRKAADMDLAKKNISPDSHRAILAGELSLEEARELGREGSPLGPAPKTVSKNDRSRLCMCGCQRRTLGRFAIGHDAKVKGMIIRAMRSGTEDELTDEQRAYGEERDLFEQTRQRMANEERREQEKAAKRADKSRK